MNIAILLPCKNEADNIIQVINDWKNAIPEAEIYVCDNNSTDNSIELAEHLGAKIFIETIPGKGSAIKKLLNEIVADVYIMCDADNTYPATREILTPILEGYDLSIGNRLSKTSNVGNVNIIKRFGNNVFSWLCQKMLKINIKDPLSGLRAFNRKFLCALELSNGFEIEMEMNAHAAKGYNVFNVPIDYKERLGGKSKLHIIKDGYRILKTLLKHTLSNKEYITIIHTNNSCVDPGEVYSTTYHIYKDKTVRIVENKFVEKVGIVVNDKFTRITENDFNIIKQNCSINSKNKNLEESWIAMRKNKATEIHNIIVISILKKL